MSLLIITAINFVEIIRDSRFIAFIIAESLGRLDYYQAPSHPVTGVGHTV